MLAMRMPSATKTTTKKGNDAMRGIPTSACPLCGDKWLLIPVQFDNDTYEIDMYGTEAACNNCGLAITAPTPLDHPEYEDNYDSYSW